MFFSQQRLDITARVCAICVSLCLRGLGLMLTVVFIAFLLFLSDTLFKQTRFRVCLWKAPQWEGRQAEGETLRLSTDNRCTLCDSIMCCVRLEAEQNRLTLIWFLMVEQGCSCDVRAPSVHTAASSFVEFLYFSSPAVNDENKRDKTTRDEYLWFLRDVGLV